MSPPPQDTTDRPAVAKSADGGPPQSPVGNGRGPGGRFLPGNKAGKGNPLNQRAQKLRAGLLRAVGVGDLRQIARKLVELAKAGDVAAAKVVLDRTLGPPVEWDLLERLERLESQLGGAGTSPGRAP